MNLMKNKKTTSKSLSLQQHSYFSGPIPPPQSLEQYERICPGAANRILKMAEKQSQHRQDLEMKIINSNIRHEKIGIHYAFIITITLSILGAILIVYDKNIEGFVVLVGPSVFHGSMYIYNRQLQKKELQQREKESAKPISHQESGR